MSDYFKQLEGEQLGAVTFVQDYIQLHFDGPSISVYTLVSVEAEGTTIRSGDADFRNALCRQIAKVVQCASLDSQSLTLIFIDGSRIAISLRASDYSGPEAICAHGFRGAPTIVI